MMIFIMMMVMLVLIMVMMVMLVILYNYDLWLRGMLILLLLVGSWCWREGLVVPLRWLFPIEASLSRIHFFLLFYI